MKKIILISFMVITVVMLFANVSFAAAESEILNELLNMAKFVSVQEKIQVTSDTVDTFDVPVLVITQEMIDEVLKDSTGTTLSIANDKIYINGKEHVVSLSSSNSINGYVAGYDAYKEAVEWFSDYDFEITPEEIKSSYERNNVNISSGNLYTISFAGAVLDDAAYGEYNDPNSRFNVSFAVGNGSGTLNVQDLSGNQIASAKYNSDGKGVGTTTSVLNDVNEVITPEKGERKLIEVHGNESEIGNEIEFVFSIDKEGMYQFTFSDEDGSLLSNLVICDVYGNPVTDEDASGLMGVILKPGQNYYIKGLDAGRNYNFFLTTLEKGGQNYTSADYQYALYEYENSIQNNQINGMDIETLQTKSAFEQAITSTFLSIGDYANDYLSQTLREDVTVDKIVFNDVRTLNANFFDKSKNKAETNASLILKDFINEWYNFFRKIALVIILISLVGAGMKIMLNTPGGKTSAYDVLKKVVVGVALVFLFPYVMRYAFDINEAIITAIREQNSISNQAYGSEITSVSDLQMDEIEFRSPLYVSTSGLRVGAGTKEATQLYLNRLEKYKSNADIMRIMRAFAGVTLRFLYVIVWYIMLAQLYILVIMYIKRYITIAFLTIIYPFVVGVYVSGGVFGKSHNAFNTWCSKYFSVIFVQTLHAIIYGVICGVIMNQLRETLNGGNLDNVNWILMIITTSFLFSAEKILQKFWKAAVDTSERGGMKNFFKAPKQFFGRLTGH